MLPGDARNILVIGPHPDDQELGMGGTIALLAMQGHRVVLLDMTNGEPTPHGDVVTRAAETRAATAALTPKSGTGSLVRLMLGQDENSATASAAAELPVGLPNRFVEHTIAARHAVAGVIRRFGIEMMFVPHPRDAHPDHLAVTRIAVDARFDAKLSALRMPGDAGMPPCHPKWLIYYYASHLRAVPEPSFIVDTSSTVEAKQLAISAYRSQFDRNAKNRDVPAWLLAQDRYFGSRIGTKAGEPFFTDEPLALNGLGGIVF